MISYVVALSNKIYWRLIANVLFHWLEIFPRFRRTQGMALLYINIARPASKRKHRLTHDSSGVPRQCTTRASAFSALVRPQVMNYCPYTSATSILRNTSKLPIIRIYQNAFVYQGPLPVPQIISILLDKQHTVVLPKSRKIVSDRGQSYRVKWVILGKNLHIFTLTVQWFPTFYSGIISQSTVNEVLRWLQPIF